MVAIMLPWLTRTHAPAPDARTPTHPDPPTRDDRGGAELWMFSKAGSRQAEAQSSQDAKRLAAGEVRSVRTPRRRNWPRRAAQEGAHRVRRRGDCLRSWVVAEFPPWLGDYLQTRMCPGIR